MFLICVILVQFFIPSILSASRNEPCTTPNNRNGRCIPVRSCASITSALQSGDRNSIIFAQQSQCGYDSVPLVCCASTDLPQEKIFDHPLLPNKDACGVQISNEKIIGGTSTEIDEFPWLVLLHYVSTTGEDAGFRCGGSLINNRYILTAAHCISLTVNEGITLDSVRLGEWRISTDRDCVGARGLQRCSEPPLDVGVQRIIPHPRYSRRTRDNDIGLVRLQNSINFNEYIQPICLPAPIAALPNVGTNMIVAGWGSTENSSTSDIKLKVSVPLVSNSDCTNRIGNRGSITENQLCAGGIAGKDSCQGDSGGPLMNFIIRNTEVQWLQEGIISWGLACGISRFPGVYTRVSRYSTWIGDNIQN